MEAILVNTGGGLVEGDRISSEIRVREGARLTVTTQAAEKIYRSLTEETRITTDLAVAEGAQLTWAPQETILFDGARLRRRQCVSVTKTSRFLAAEIVIFGRIARGERFTCGSLRDNWAIRCRDKLLWMDCLRLDEGFLAEKARRFAFGDSAGLGTIIYFGPDSASILPVAQDAAARLGGGATLVNGVLLARFLNDDEAQLRAASFSFAEELHKSMAGSVCWENA
ncbi:urease accessory protein UreD [Methylocella tundrae]|jgi:urease accessory protein|uniref:Urease accessory protein UreD n=1 Tax=Methylocella tundrae TaxID=227605 RepID=A0A4U8Z2Z8_METTU